MPVSREKSGPSARGTRPRRKRVKSPSLDDLRNSAPPSAVQQPPVKRPPWMTIAALGAVAGTLFWFLDFPGKINSFAKEWPEASQRIGDAFFLDRELSGVWTSENTAVDADSHAHDLPELPGGPVDIELRVYKGEVTGEIVSGGLMRFWIHSRVQVEGRKVGKAIVADVWDYLDGKKIRFAVVKIEPDQSNEGVLTFKALKQAVPFVPARARLYPSESLPEGEFNERMLESAIGAVEASEGRDR